MPEIVMRQGYVEPESGAAELATSRTRASEEHVTNRQAPPSSDQRDARRLPTGGTRHAPAAVAHRSDHARRTLALALTGVVVVVLFLAEVVRGGERHIPTRSGSTPSPGPSHVRLGRE